MINNRTQFNCNYEATISSAAFIDKHQERLIHEDLDRMIQWLRSKDSKDLPTAVEASVHDSGPLITIQRTRRNAVDYGRDKELASNQISADSSDKKKSPSIANAIRRKLNRAVKGAFKSMSLVGRSTKRRPSITSPYNHSNNSQHQQNYRRPSLNDQMLRNRSVRKGSFESMGRKLSEIPSMSLIFDSEEQSPRQQQPSAPDAVPVPDDLSQSAEMRGFLTIEVKLDDLTIRIPWFHHELLGLFRSGRGHGAYYVRQLKKKIKERLAIRGYALTGSEMNSVLIEYHPPVSNNANDSDKEQQEEQQQTLCQLIETDGDLCDALQSNAGYNCDTLILSLFTFK